MRQKLLTSITLLTFLTSFIISCDTTSTNTEPGKGSLDLQFKTTSSTSYKAISGDNITASGDSLIIDGTNGSLKIDDIRFIVGKFKLEPAEMDEEEDSLDTEAKEFEAGPFWVDLPLGTDTLNLGNSQVQEGLYEELEFEVKDLDLNDEDEGEYHDHQAVTDSIRTEFPAWPDNASMVLVGTFTSENGNSQPFKVFAKAEIEIEREFPTPLEVTANNMQDVLSVQINPTKWFTQTDGNVTDLSKFDWDEHQELLEFEAEFENGVEEIEMDERDEDEENDENEDEDEEDDEDDS